MIISVKAATSTLLFLVGALTLQALPYSFTDQAEADAEAVQALVKLLQRGEEEKAKSGLQRLHEAGNIKATTLIGLMHLGDGSVAENRVIASFYLNKASRKGDAHATFIYARLQGNAEGYAEMMLKSAEQGHLVAAEEMARCYLEGRGVTVDKAKAYRWLFSIILRTPHFSDALEDTLGQLTEELPAKDLEAAMIEALNFAYIDTKSAVEQAKFEANNPGFDGRITADNFHYVDGELIIRAEKSD